MKHNAQKLYAFSFFYMFLVIIPVIVPFFSSLGLSMSQTFQLQSLFGLGVVIFEVPTGYACDLWGRKRSLIIGSILTGIGFSYLTFVDSFWGLAAFELIIALASSFVSGADVALLYDSFGSQDRNKATVTLANMQMASVSGESVASLLGGYLAAISFHHVVVANAIAGWIPLCIAFSFKEPPYEKLSSKNHLKNFTDVFKHIWQSKDPLLALCFWNLTVWGLSTFIAVWILQHYWKLQNLDLKYFGLLWAALNISVGIIGKTVHHLEKRIGAVPLLIALGLLPILGYVGTGLSGGTLGIACGFLFYAGRGITHVLLKDALNWRTPASFRATANSLQSLLFRLGFAVVGPFIGMGIDRYGLKPTVLTVAGVFSLFFIFLLVPLIRRVRIFAPKEIPELR